MSKAKKWLGNLFILVWLLMVLGIAGVRWEFFPLQIGLLAGSLSAAIAFVYGVLLLPVVFYKLLFRKPVTAASLAMCIFGLLPAVTLLLTVSPSGLRAPAIHDITTDTDTPPQFVLAAAQRVEGDNSVEYEGDVIARLQKEAYPHIQPLVIKQGPEKALETVKATVNNQGWELLGVRRPEDSRAVSEVEAVDSSAIFGFEDDVIIRISNVPEGTKIDVRSASRVGLGDLGANARRISGFLEELEENF